MWRNRRGQAVVEFALVVPVLAALLFGGLYVTILIANDIKAGYAVGAGARLAAELGGDKSNPPGTTTAQIDAQIVNDVKAALQGSAFMTVDEIDIYRVTSSDGTVQMATDHVNAYNAAGGALATAFPFPLTERVQYPPGETSIGVRLVWHYTTPLVGFGRASTTTYAVMRCAPVTS